MQPLPNRYMQTYGIRQHQWRKAKCEEVDCKNFQLGWSVTVDLATDLGQAQAHYIKFDSGRKYRVERTSETVATLIFEAGQQCFTEHKLPAGDPNYIIKRNGGSQVLRAENWLDDFENNQANLARIVERG